MTKSLATVVVVAALMGAACSASEATSNVGTLDASAVEACRELRLVMQARAGGRIQPADLRARLSQVYTKALSTANPIIRARAVAVFADATEIASGGEGRSLGADLEAMDQACSGARG